MTDLSPMPPAQTEPPHTNTFYAENSQVLSLVSCQYVCHGLFLNSFFFLILPPQELSLRTSLRLLEVGLNMKLFKKDGAVSNGSPSRPLGHAEILYHPSGQKYSSLEVKLKRCLEREHLQFTCLLFFDLFSQWHWKESMKIEWVFLQSFKPGVPWDCQEL